MPRSPGRAGSVDDARRDDARRDDAHLAGVSGPLEGVAVHAATAPDGTPVVLDTHLDGPDAAPVLLLVSGLGAQRVSWPPEFVAAVHAAGWRTLSVDNRDAGRSTVLAGEPADLPRSATGRPVPPYDLADIAADLIAVCDAYELAAVDVLGMSMGGMVAQHLAFAYPERVRTLTSLMSTTGRRDVGFPHPRVNWVLSTPAPLTLEEYLPFAVEVAEAIGSPGIVDHERIAARGTVTFHRGIHPRGTARQLLAIRADGDRTTRLGDVRAPTLVVHGGADPLIDVSGGHATARAVAGARLVVVPGMGHDLPVALLGEVLDPVVAHLSGSTTGGGRHAPTRV